MFSLPQVARTWWKDSRCPEAAAQVRVRDLASAGLVQVQRAPAHPEIPLTSPMVVWDRCQPKPDFGAVAYQLQARWKEHPVATTCIIASQTAARMFSGHGGRFSRAVERTHDLHHAAVYLLYRLRTPELLDGWKHEEEIRQNRGRNTGRLPDAILEVAGERRAIEFGGSYSKQKLMAFHAYCERQSLSYEVW